MPEELLREAGISPEKHPHLVDELRAHLKEKPDWFVATALCTIIFLLFWYYLYLRRGILVPFLSEEPLALFLANKSLALTSLFAIGISLSIGPLARFFRSFKHKLEYRREIGLMGFFVGAAHILITLVFLTYRFPLVKYIERWKAPLYGIMALLILIVVASISTTAAIRKMGYRRWKFMQRLSYIAFILIALHFSVMKYAEWVKWFASYDPVYPPGSLLAIIFVGLVLLLRASVLVIDLAQKDRYSSKIIKND
ncbi:MAG TPA: ferric reductase-like transmembrane domain-containing protein [Candidatus Nanoarchaeia archaeon]|nr:ferric reductase-like transmembrane domain-containing protein [Candidatus Nanoarchaeia archaeon]